MSFIVLDFDETYTEHPVLFDTFITNANNHGIELIICTARHNRPDDKNEDVELTAHQHNIEIVYAGSDSKWNAIKKAGYIPENAIWIDDTPRAIEGLNWD